MLAVLMILMPIILIAGGAFALWLQVRAWRGATMVEGWSMTEGRVVSSDVGVVGGDWQLHPLYRLLRIFLLFSGRSVSGPRYEPRVTYEYTVDGHACAGRRFRMGSLATTEADAARLAAEYPVGAAVRVYYNPRKPADAVLVTGLDGANFGIGLFGAVVVLCIGLGFGIWIARGTTSHAKSVAGVAFSPDGTRVVSGGSDSMIRMWDARTGKEIWRQEADIFPVTAVAFSPKGDVVASGQSDESIRLWDAATGAPLRRIECPTDTVNALAFSPDGRYLASVCGWDFNRSGPSVALWDVASGGPVRQFKGHLREVNAVAFSPDGQTIATGSDDKTLRLWDVATGTELRSITAASSVEAVAFSGDGKRIAGQTVGDIVVWETATGKSLATMGAWVYAVAFSPDGTLLAGAGTSISTENQLTLWDSATGKVIRQFPAQGDDVNVVAFDPTGTLLVSGGDDKTVRIWEVATGKERRNFTRAMWAP